MQFDIDVTAKGSFIARSIASTSASPNHIVFDTLYDPTPTFGLVAGDKIRVYFANGNSPFLDTTVSSIVDGVTIAVADDPSSYGTGDIVFLRAATTDIDTNILDPFLWTRTEFRFQIPQQTLLPQHKLI